MQPVSCRSTKKVMGEETMKHIMLDLETMGTNHNAAIVAIGAVQFSMPDGFIDRFYRPISLQSSVDEGLEISPKTVLWWLKQSSEARELFNSDAATLKAALHDFSSWIDDGSEYLIWGNGVDFDNSILANAYDKCRMETPWKFYNNRCYRTISEMHPDVKMERIGTHHNAVNDAESQANRLFYILKKHYPLTNQGLWD